jgi:hypothetical protein
MPPRLGRRGHFKRFCHERFLFHTLYQTLVGDIADKARKLCVVIADDTCAIDDDIIQQPIALPVRHAEIEMD